MRSIARSAYLALAWAFVAALVGQVFLAGLGVFDSPTAFATHRDVGYTLSIVPILLLIIGLVGGSRRATTRDQTRPRTRSINRPSTRSPSARRPLCSNSSVCHVRRPRIVAAVSSAKSRSTNRSLT
jgi:hypothetical protein